MTTGRARHTENRPALLRRKFRVEDPNLKPDLLLVKTKLTEAIYKTTPPGPDRDRVPAKAEDWFDGFTWNRG